MFNITPPSLVKCFVWEKKWISYKTYILYNSNIYEKHKISRTRLHKPYLNLFVN